MYIAKSTLGIELIREFKYTTQQSDDVVDVYALLPFINDTITHSLCKLFDPTYSPNPFETILLDLIEDVMCWFPCVFNDIQLLDDNGTVLVAWI